MLLFCMRFDCILLIVMQLVLLVKLVMMRQLISKVLISCSSLTEVVSIGIWWTHLPNLAFSWAML